MTEITHILNGDSTRYGLDQANILGDIVVWREMMVEGPLIGNVGSKIFWKERSNYFKKNLETKKSIYQIKVIDEIRKIPLLKTKEIVLWFEYDLFCQINLLALCSYLNAHYQKETKYSLICVGNQVGYKGLTALGHINPADYPRLLEERKTLTKTDLKAAHQYYKLFAEGSIDDLKKCSILPVFEYLSAAIAQFEKLTPDQHGLNQIDKQLLNCLKERKTEIQLIKMILEWQQKNTVYGFGDLQYVKALQKLATYYSVENDYYILNEKGIAIIDGN